MPALTATRPAAPHEDDKARLAAAVEAARDEILDLSHRIHADPGARLRGAPRRGLDRRGPAPPRLRRRPSGRQPGHRRPGHAARRPAGEGPRIGILAEYDALPGLGHGCGHNTMAASGVGAAIALAAIADDLPGEIVFLGTPAEERGSGKQIMIDDGLFEGLDAALLYHPCDRDRTSRATRSPRRTSTSSSPGSSRTPSSDPWRGKNALDALIVLFTSVGLWRQQLRPTRARPRHHPRGRDGGQHHPGPDRGLVHDPQRRRGRLRARCATASATCARRPRWRPTRPSRSTFSGRARTMRNNRVLAERFRANMAAYGIADQGDDPNAGLDRHGQRQLGLPDHPPRPRDRARGHARPLDPVPRRGRSRPGPTRSTLLAATLVAQTALSCSATRPSSRPPGRNSATTDPEPAERATGGASRVHGRE